jgi:hypothetical protein
MLLSRFDMGRVITSLVYVGVGRARNLTSLTLSLASKSSQTEESHSKLGVHGFTTIFFLKISNCCITAVLAETSRTAAYGSKDKKRLRDSNFPDGNLRVFALSSSIVLIR